MGVAMSDLDLAAAPEETIEAYLRDWREGGGKTLGYSCLAAPVEIIEAAGILPYRLKAFELSDSEVADAYMSRYNCKFCRACLQLALTGAFDFLDGLIATNGCDHMRGMFENWQYVRESDFYFYLRVPHSTASEFMDYFTAQLNELKEAISAHFSVEISDQDLERAMSVQGEVRDKLRALFALRERSEPAISGSGLLKLMAIGSSLRSEDFSRMLSGLLEDGVGAAVPSPRARLMVCGSVTDEIGLLEQIESLGCAVVADSFCFGTRASWPETGKGGSPLRLLAEKYVANLLCPRMFADYDRRRDYVLETARRAGVDGAIVFHNKFCDMHGVEAVSLRADLEKEGIPVLVLDKEYGSQADTGRIRTRVQALLERIGG